MTAAAGRSLKQQIITPGKGGAFIQVEMRDLKTGNKTNERWRTADTVERLLTDNKDYIYSYTDGDNLVLMDKETYEQAMVPSELLGDGVAFLQDNMAVTLGPRRRRPGWHSPAGVGHSRNCRGRSGDQGPDGDQLLQARETVQRRQDDGAALHRDGGAHRGPHRGRLLYGAGRSPDRDALSWPRVFPLI